MPDMPVPEPTRLTNPGDEARRGTDAALALLLLVVLAPVMAVLWLLVSLDGGPVLDTRPRVGRSGRAFRCLGFRTVGAGARQTRIGRLLRDTGLDELPLLFNVLRGDLSLSELRADCRGGLGRQPRFR
jgi:lipopolysaccharide/colanic/teichoic acid biosynthesis glycosyltransferase